MTSEEPHSNLLRSNFFDLSETPFILYDKRLNIIDANAATQKLYQLDRSELLGKNIVEISPNVKTEGRFEMYLKVIETGNSIVLDDVRLIPTLESNFYCRIKAFKVGEGLGIVATDITDIRNILDELDSFVYRSSHDMRAPIASILGLATITKNSATEPDTVISYLKMIKNEALRLDQTLQKLLKIARIQQADRTITIIDFKLLLNNVIHTLSFVEGYESTKFHIDNKVTKDFYNQVSTLATIFQNILDNTIKYRKINEPHNDVYISIEDVTNGIQIKVTDKGIGIPKEQQNEVFKMFFRGSSQAPGSGLGLYTVKHHISNMGGNIQLESQEHEGTQIQIYLPNMKDH
ncbi:MAG TPA: ATP-binding protein [Cytophagales bacterium]|nr:ATP-binding protein [Cytophagales bacterium]